MDAKALIFLRNDHTNKDGTQTVYLRLYIDNVKKDFSLKIKIKPKLWNDKEKRVQKKHKLSHQINLLIDKELQKAQSIIFEAQLNDRFLSFDDFERQFRGLASNELFIEFAKNYYKENANEHSKETLRSYNTDLNMLNRFKTGLTFKQVNNTRFLDEYKKHLLNIGNSQNTIYKKLKLIRTVLYKAKDKGLIKDNVFQNYSIKFYQTEVVYLTIDELKRIENLVNDTRVKIYQLKVLDAFLFSCYTGLRRQDIRNLKYKNIIFKDAIDRKTQKHKRAEYVSTLMQKTKNTTAEIVEVPLMDKAKKIIGTGLQEQNVFNLRANPAKVVKELMNIAGIDKNANYNSSRHTFAVLLLASGTDIFTLSKLMGHSDIKSTLKYAKVVDETKIDAIERREEFGFYNIR
ncbi:MAG: hypothetical protein B6I20_03345 [Bacteroidetes bacterium 4572_117]|nr:MAG: hypothetical protein B6I20_03345 [Bacteroidetes bacterium 4572_117]